MSINSLEKYISNRLTNHLMRTGLLKKDPARNGNCKLILNTTHNFSYTNVRQTGYSFPFSHPS